jgi:hypothetical protein
MLCSPLSRVNSLQVLENQVELDEFFAGRAGSRRLFEALQAVVVEIGPAELRVTKSQVAFCRAKPFVWIPGQYLRGKTAPLVLTLSFFHRDPSPRWKEIVQPSAKRFTHHLELYTLDQIDDEVRAWLRAAYCKGES